MNKSKKPEKTDIVLSLHAIRQSFTQGDNKLDVLRGCHLDVHKKQRIALVGPSGSGKSTLLQIAGLLEKPQSGEIWIAGQKVEAENDAKRTILRRQSIGFVYQFHHLLPEFSARENIMLPQMIEGRTKTEAARRADELLNLVGLKARAHHRPAQLSGGEQQRIAIARALANRPALLIADEPTGNLDPHTAEHVFKVLEEVIQVENSGLLMATHNLDLASRMDCSVTLKDGIIIQHT